MATRIRTRPPLLPEVSAILGRAGSENFTVASRLLPASSRRHLISFYGYARLIDHIGDDYVGDRLAALDWAHAELDAAMSDPTTVGLHPLIASAASSARELGVGAEPFTDLIEANRRDQHVTRYATWDDLLGYCRLSANPIGALVLAAFDSDSSDHRVLSDRVCSALQVAEHLQDVGEDAAARRVYLPLDDLRRFGVDPHELGEPASTTPASTTPASTALRALIAFEAARTRELLDAGAPLVDFLHGRSRIAVAGFVAGGYAALDAVADTGFDPLTHRAKPSRLGVARHLPDLLRPARLRPARLRPSAQRPSAQRPSALRPDPDPARTR